MNEHHTVCAIVHVIDISLANIVYLNLREIYYPQSLNSFTARISESAIFLIR